MKPFIPFVILCISWAGFYSSQLNAAAPTYNLQFGITNEDFGSGDDDTYKQLTGSIGYAKGLSRNSVVNFNADVFTRAYSDFENQDSNGVLLEAIYSYIPTTGFTKPVYSIGLRQEFQNFDSSDRDFSRTSIILADTIRIDDQVTLTGGIEVIDKSSDIEDSSLMGLFINSDFRLNSQWIIYIYLKLQNEEIESSSSGSSSSVIQTAVRDDISGHHTPGESGGSSLPGSSSSSDSDSDNTYITLGANYFIDSNQSLDVSYQRRKYSLSGGGDLSGTLISIDYFYKF